MTKKDLGERLKEIRKSVKVPHFQSCEIVEKGKKNYTADTLFNFCKNAYIYLKVSGYQEEITDREGLSWLLYKIRRKKEITANVMPNISIPTVYMIDRNLRNYKIDSIIAYCNALDLSLVPDTYEPELVSAKEAAELLGINKKTFIKTIEDYGFRTKKRVNFTYYYK